MARSQIKKATVSPLQRCRNFLAGQILLFRFLFVDGWRLLAEVGSAWDNSESSAELSGSADSRMWVRLSRDVVDGYNRRYEATRLQLRDLVHNRGHFVGQYVVPLFLVRIATVAAAAFFGVGMTFVVSLLQFVVAPYSLFAAIAAWIGVVPYLIMHFATFAIVQTATGALYAYIPIIGHFARIPITVTLIAIWFLLDQFTCVLLCFWSPWGKPVRVSPGRMLQSIWYGFINAKTYWLILLLCLRGFHIDVLALALVAFMPSIMRRVSNRVFRLVLPPRTAHWTFPSVMFYHYHRMVHLPGPYNEAHRHHHYLADATPFDAHMTGTGMPEEWLKLFTEIGLCLATGIVPWSFSLPMILQSADNKYGHTRLEGEHPAHDNFHVNHHLKHFRNFGFAGFPLDLLFDTALGDVSRLDHKAASRTRCVKETSDEHYVLVFESLGTGSPVATSDLLAAPPH